MLFSQRIGLTPVRSALQIDQMDSPLRNGLWDSLQLFVWAGEGANYNDLEDTQLDGLFSLYWHRYFKKPIDTLPYKARDAIQEVREYFFACAWYEVYDFIEFTAAHCTERRKFIDFVDAVLERELSGFRFIDKEIVAITTEQEVESIELALKKTETLAGANAHLRASLELLSDRTSPDYRNSIKEAISAVESISQTISGDPAATLGAALKALEKKELIHPALKSSLSALYGYTSDAGGIRHAMLEEPTLTFTDAKFMLVSCTGFVNYLLGKANDGGIKLS